jgi:Glycosyl transferase family 2
MIRPTFHQKQHILLSDALRRLRGDQHVAPRASIVVPVNAQNDLLGILTLASDITNYRGGQPIEFIIVANNYPANHPPKEIREYQRLGFRVLGIPKVIHTGGIAIAARILGIEAARSEIILLFDADCRIPNPTSLFDWYINQLDSGFDLAYTHVDYFDLPVGLSIKVRMFIHHASRWYKRVLLGIPTSRGSNYAIRRKMILELSNQGHVHYDIQVGPAVKAMGGAIAYSKAREHVVFTSGRFFSNSWKELFNYLIWRIGYYLRVKPTKPATPHLDK